MSCRCAGIRSSGCSSMGCRCAGISSGGCSSMGCRCAGIRSSGCSSVAGARIDRPLQRCHCHILRSMWFTSYITFHNGYQTVCAHLVNRVGHFHRATAQRVSRWRAAGAAGDDVRCSGDRISTLVPGVGASARRLFVGPASCPK